MNNQFDICICGHNRNHHEARYAKPSGECDALVDGKQCACRGFEMNNGTQHTPGPWTVGTKHPGRVFSQHFNVAFTTIPQDEGTETEEEKANARLIAAAPEMLKALKFISDALRDSPDFKEYATTSDGDQFHPLSLARAAIAKAEAGAV
jgi:hypothetical protein